MATSARCKALAYAFNHTKSPGWIGDWKEMVWWGLMGFYGVRAGIHTDGNSCEHIIWPWDFWSPPQVGLSWCLHPTQRHFHDSTRAKDSHQALETICEWSKCFVTSEERKPETPRRQGKSENHQREQRGSTNLVGFVCQHLGESRTPKWVWPRAPKTPGSPCFANLCVNSDKAHLAFKLGPAVVKVRQQSPSRFSWAS